MDKFKKNEKEEQHSTTVPMLKLEKNKLIDLWTGQIKLSKAISNLDDDVLDEFLEQF